MKLHIARDGEVIDARTKAELYPLLRSGGVFPSDLLAQGNGRLETTSRITVWQERSGHTRAAADANESHLTLGRVHYQILGASIDG